MAHGPQVPATISSTGLGDRLCIAAGKGHIQEVRGLLHHGADVNHKGYEVSCDQKLPVMPLYSCYGMGTMLGLSKQVTLYKQTKDEAECDHHCA